MDKLFNTRETIKIIKFHDKFLSETRINLSNNNKITEESNIYMSQILNKVNNITKEIEFKNKIINNLKQENSELKEIKINFEKYKIQNENDKLKYKELIISINDLEEKVKYLIEDNKELNISNNNNKNNYDEMKNDNNILSNKYDNLIEQHNIEINELYDNNKILEEQNEFYQKNEIKIKNKQNDLIAENDNFKKDIYNKIVKIEHIELKLKEKYYIDKLFSDLKINFDELKKENKNIKNNYEQKLFFKVEECKNNAEERDDLHRLNCKYQQQLNDKNSNIDDNNNKIQDLFLKIKILSNENNKKEEILTEKQAKLDYLSKEINDMNYKLLEFGDMMEKLITENQKLKIKIEQSNNNEDLIRIQKNEINNFRSTIKEQKYCEFTNINNNLRDISY